MMTRRFLATFALTLATLIGGASSASAQIFGQPGAGGYDGGSSYTPPTPPSTPPIINIYPGQPGWRGGASGAGAGASPGGRSSTWSSSTPPSSRPFRMQASVVVHAHEVFGGTRYQWENQRTELERRYQQLITGYQQTADAARRARSRSEYDYYAEQGRRIRAEGQRVAQRHAQIARVLSLWDRPTTFVYYEGPSDGRYPVVADPYTYLRSHPELIGSEVVARQGM